MSAKPLVLVVGPTGKTGLPVVNSLLESGDFSVAGIVRKASAANPEVKELESKGVKIHAIDWATAPLDELIEVLKGVEFLISTCNWEVLDEQTRLVDAAKAAGSVKRFIPCDWATVAPPGVMVLSDRKHRIEAYANAVGVPITRIDVGIWYELTFPPNVKVIPEDFNLFQKIFSGFYNDGKVKTTVVNRLHCGRFIPSILKDERTIGQKVMANEAEVTREQVWAWADKYSGRKFTEKIIPVTTEEVEQALKEKPGDILWEYANNMYIREDNTEENAKKNGYLIARELYPDVPVQTAEEWAKEYYAGASS